VVGPFGGPVVRDFPGVSVGGRSPVRRYIKSTPSGWRHLILGPHWSVSYVTEAHLTGGEGSLSHGGWGHGHGEPPAGWAAQRGGSVTYLSLEWDNRPRYPGESHGGEPEVPAWSGFRHGRTITLESGADSWPRRVTHTGIRCLGAVVGGGLFVLPQ
jgi:hypothetical protein